MIRAAIDVVAAYAWYRFADKLERSIRDFERWQKQ
jgi:hypothetical protein